MEKARGGSSTRVERHDQNVVVVDALDEAFEPALQRQVSHVYEGRILLESLSKGFRGKHGMSAPD